MNKPVYLMPFIFVYKMVLFITKLVFSIPKYSAIGFFLINITIITLIVNGIYGFTSYFLNGFIFLSFLVFKTLTLPFKIFKKKEKELEIEIIDEVETSPGINSVPVPVVDLTNDVEQEILQDEIIEQITDENPVMLEQNTIASNINDTIVIEPDAPLEKIGISEEEVEPITENGEIISQVKIDKKVILEEKLKQKELEAARIAEQKELNKLEEIARKQELQAIKEKRLEEKRTKRLIVSEARARRRYSAASKVVSFFRYYYYGFMFMNFIVYKAIKYIAFGFIFPFVLLFNAIVLVLAALHKKTLRISERMGNKKKLKERISKEEARNRIMIEKRRKAAEKLAAADKKREDAVRKREESLAKKREEKDKNTYINDKVKIEKRTMGDVINSLLERIVKFPKDIKANIIKKYNSLAFVKNKINQQDISREALLINFDGEDAVKSTVKILYEYIGKSPEGKVTKGYFEAFSKVEVHSFLLSEGFEVYSITTNKWIKLLYGRSSTNNTKVKNKDLIFFLTQLSTYIKAGIPLVEALKILSRQFRQKSYQRIFKTMIYDLTMGENFSTSLEKQGVAFPRLLVNMVKASEMTGELPEVLDNMSEYYTQTEKTRKQMITAMIYPSIVFVMSMAVVTFIIMFVVPKFVDIYSSMDAAQIPGFTIFVINLSEFVEKNIIWIFLGFAAFVLTLHYLYKNVKIIRTLMQWLFMRTPVLGNIIIYNEVTIFTKTFSSLLSHNVFITDSMEVLNRITNNEIYKMIIVDTISNLAKGDKISKSFSNHWAFPIPAYEMLVTGEKTGQLPEMMGKVSDYYQDLHQNSVTRLKTLIEPILLVFLTFVVGGIILAVIVPMFSMFTMIK